MSEKVKFTIDGKEYEGEKGRFLVDVAAENGVYIPVLCHWKDVSPAASCRICTVKVNDNFITACTTTVDGNMEVENDTPELLDMRKAIIEMLFVEGNHFCPACEKSGECDLQALAYRYQMMVPRFPQELEQRKPDASSPKIFLDKNRCIFCKRCVRMIKDEQGRSYFAFKGRGNHLEINIDKKLAANISEEMAQKAMEICPVGAILRKEIGFIKPIGERKYDYAPIGTDIENLQK